MHHTESVINICMLPVVPALHHYLIMCIVFSIKLLGFSVLLAAAVAHAFVLVPPNRNSLQTKRPLLATIDKESSTNQCTLTLKDQKTKCEIVLVGCFHGSQTSAADVRRAIMAAAEPNVIVLELCPSRYTALQQTILSNTTTSKEPSWLVRYSQMIRGIRRQQGLAAGFAAAVIAMASAVQARAGGLEPGLEFATAMQGRAHVVLADQRVEETLQKLGSLHETAWDLCACCFSNGWDESFGKEADALNTAVFGDSNVAQQLNLPLFLWRSPESRNDMLRLFLPPLLGLQVISLWLQSFANDDVIVDSALLLQDTPVSRFVLNMILLGAVYLGVALPAARIVLRERDDQLTAGIRAACRVAHLESTTTNNGRVVAVLGLLHVNGIAKRLLSEG
jgi:hypothetical protein